MIMDDRLHIYVVFGVDGDVSIPRAWFENHTNAVKYLEQLGSAADYMVIKRSAEGEFIE